jgi:hypothetical protein
MNNKKAKQIRKQVKPVLVSWLKGLLSDEEAAKVNLFNVLNYMPTQTHFISERTMYLSAYHPKWVSNKIKKLLRAFPNLKINNVDLELVQWLLKNGSP